MKTLLLIAALCSTAAYADDANWTTVGDNGAQFVVKFKNRSCAITDGTVACIAQTNTHSTLWVGYIGTTTAACIKGYGRIVEISLDGGTTVAKIDVVAGGESVGSTVFDFLCSFAAKAT